MLNNLNRNISALADFGIMIYMLYRVMITSDLGLGGFAVAVNSIWKMSWLMRDLVDRIMKYHEHGLFVEKNIRFVSCKPKIVSGTRTANSFQTLEISNLCFAYHTGEHNTEALHSVTMKINKGEKIAIVGYNGAGKTTLTKLIMRLYDPTDGNILYNGVPMSEYTPESLRSRMAAVFQDYRIFAAGIGENVVGGEYDSSMEERVLLALRKSTFSGKLKILKNGLKTELTREFSNEGTQLSGGEQQKIAISRAFYKNADLIILDEPSSSLDPDAEYELNRAISDYADKKTVIFISHRLSTTRHADRIYMFVDGGIAEVGTHDKLMKMNGKYAYMFNLQAENYKKTDE